MAGEALRSARKTFEKRMPLPSETQETLTARWVSSQNDGKSMLVVPQPA